MATARGEPDPLAAFAEPHRTRIREAAYALACALTDAIPPANRGNWGRARWEVELERAIHGWCVPGVRVVSARQREAPNGS
jgi:hypothetical protein